MVGLLSIQHDFYQHEILYLPAKGFVGEDSFSYKVTSSDGRSSDQMANILILVSPRPHHGNLNTDKDELLLEPFHFIYRHFFNISSFIAHELSNFDQSEFRESNILPTLSARTLQDPNYLPEYKMNLNGSLHTYSGTLQLLFDTDERNINCITTFGFVPQINSVYPETVTTLGGKRKK